nr:ulp1 protease family, C-terminal catalytic domain-containing protein [Tanacetum cinerariifolium]
MFYTKKQDDKSTVQNSGVTLIATTIDSLRTEIVKDSYYGSKRSTVGVDDVVDEDEYNKSDELPSFPIGFQSDAEAGRSSFFPPQRITITRQVAISVWKVCRHSNLEANFYPEKNWKDVTKEEKNFLWSDIKAHFRLENDDVKKQTLLSCGTKWKAFKTRLRVKFMLKNKLRAQARARGQKQITHPRVGPKGVDPLIMVLRPEHGGRTRGVGCDIGYKKGVEGDVRKKRTSEQRKDNEEIRNEVRQQMKEELKSSDFWLEMRAELKVELRNEILVEHNLSPREDDVPSLVELKSSLNLTTNMVRNESQGQQNESFSSRQDHRRLNLSSTKSIVREEQQGEQNESSSTKPVDVSTLVFKIQCIKGHIKVAVLKVMEKHKNIELPVPDDELPYLESVVNGFIQWPIFAIGRYKGTSKPPVTEVLTKRLMPQHEKAPLSKKGKVNDTPKEPNKKDKASKDTTNKQKSIQRVFCQTDEFYFALNATNIIEFLTYIELELGILTLFEIRHYVLHIICLKDGRGFILNPQKDSQTNENCYRLAGLMDAVVGSLKWDFPLVNRQPKDWECGYYVMKWMHDFVLKYQNDNFPNIVPRNNERPLDTKELNTIIGAWHILDLKMMMSKNRHFYHVVLSGRHSKTRLRVKFMLKNVSPLTKWTHIEPNVWDQFYQNENTAAKNKLRAQARARGQKQITRPRVGPKGYRGFEKQWEEERNDPDKATELHLIPNLCSSNYCLARAPRDKVGIKQLPAELIDVSKKLKKRTSEQRKDNEEIRNEVRQQMKEELKSSDFWLEMRAELKVELRNEILAEHNLSPREDDVPSSVELKSSLNLTTNMKLRKGHMKVAILKVMEKHKNIELPVPDDELPYLESAVNGFIQWPIFAIGRYKETSKPPVTEVPTKRLMPQHERAPSSKKGKVNDTPKEPNKKDKASEDTNNKQKLIQRVENEKAANRKRL